MMKDKAAYPPFRFIMAERYGNKALAAATVQRQAEPHRRRPMDDFSRLM
jgi:hypothetical protein